MRDQMFCSTNRVFQKIEELLRSENMLMSTERKELVGTLTTQVENTLPCVG